MYHRPEWVTYVCQYLMSVEKEEAPENKSFFLELILLCADTPEQAYEAAVEGVKFNGDRFHDEDGNMMILQRIGVHDIWLLQDTWDEIKEASKSDYGYNLCNIKLPDRLCAEVLIKRKEDMALFRYR